MNRLQKLTSTLFCDDLRHSRCKSSYIISSPIRQTLHCGSMPLAILHRLTSPRSHRVRFVIGLSLLFLPVLGAEVWVFQPANKEVLTRLNIASTFDTATARRTIEALDAQGDDANDTPATRATRFRIIVLDTVTALLGPQLSGVSSQGKTPISAQLVLSCLTPNMTPRTCPHLTPAGHAEMTMFMRLLRDAAQKHRLCVLVSCSFGPFTHSTPLPLPFGITRGQSIV
jgi:hypothetical protein